ncbi:MAG: Hpt domain-containing protein [Armatimonadota bacterium]|nr:Hpt domain-containing protein [Armatimonadota bacterium]MDW8289247.1 Hpt domain-containing protein [Armatimonadota bacterium]
MLERYYAWQQPASTNLPPVDREFLSEMTGGDLEFERELLQEFLNTVPELVERIHAAIASGDSAALANAAHTLKGSARAVGARRLAEAALALEMTAKEQRLDQAADAEQTLATEYQHVRIYIQEQLLQNAA